MMNERKHALEMLLNFEQPLERIKNALAAFSWDADTKLAFLSIGRASNILNRFVNGRASAIEVENWANAVEGRDDIGFESPNEERLRELVHELANPLLTQPLTRQRAIELLKEMEATVRSKNV